MAHIREYSPPPPGCTEALLGWCQLVCYTAVFSVVTQRSSPLWGGALRDDAKIRLCSRLGANEPQPSLRKKGFHFVTLVKTLKTQGLTSNLLSSPDKKKIITVMCF